jgi:putative nucleotidyltransferase with HDIG domain
VGAATLAHELMRDLQPLDNSPRSDLHAEPISKTTERDRIFALVRVVRERDILTAEHSRRVATYARRLARALGYNRTQAHHFALLGLLHDVGKAWLPNSLLEKSEPLTEEEYRDIQQHTINGEMIVRGFDLPEWLALGVGHHHEAFDGSGYPDGWAGDQIPYAARLISVVDAFDVITSDRPYKQAATCAVALDAIERDAGTKLDPEIARVFVDLAQAHPSFVLPQRLCVVSSHSARNAAWVQVATGF